MLTDQEYKVRIGMLTKECDTAVSQNNSKVLEIRKMSVQLDLYKEELSQCKQIISSITSVKENLERKVEELSEYKELAETVGKVNMDAKDVIRVIQRRVFQRNSDATRYLNNEIDVDCPYLEESSLNDVIKHVMDITKDCSEEDKPKVKSVKASKGLKSVRKHKRRMERNEAIQTLSRKRAYGAELLESVGIDASNLPKNAKLIRRKDKASGEDVWYVKLYFYNTPKVTYKEYKIGRFNVPGDDPVCSKYPNQIIKNNPLMPSFVRFYMDSKFNYNLSENRILSILKGMHVDMPQSSLNRWMHQIMELLRTNLEPLMLETIRQSECTNNDGTRILVRSRNTEDKFKYNIEYIQAALSLEKKLVVMLYKNGTRDHSLQEEMVFKNSSIKCFIADRAPQYAAIVKDLPEMNLVRQSCLFHARHMLVNAFLVDPRVEDTLMLINTLFHIERVFKEEEEDQSPKARLRYRLQYSKPIAKRLMKRLESIKAAGDEYGALVQKAVNYILDDKESFLEFLQDGRIDVHNIAIERCFRNIAMGRRNWLHSGSHEAAQNIAFMFGLLESCKLNNLNFGEYIEDILTRILNKETVDMSFIPCNYTPRIIEEDKVA